MMDVDSIHSEEEEQLESESIYATGAENDEEYRGFAVQTAFDGYFLISSKPSRTSSNVFSAQVSPLSPEEYSNALSSPCYNMRHPSEALWNDPDVLRRYFSRFQLELEEGFNLLFYGAGSKREILNQFARESRRKGNVIVVNGFQPNLTLKDLLTTIEAIPELQSPNSSSAPANVDAQTQRIYNLFSQPDVRSLYLVVHNIDGPTFRTTKAKSCLSFLALSPNIHVVASVDHIASPLLWTSTEIFSRKWGTTMNKNNVPRRGFAWLWHDLTTLAPYDFELSYADRTSISGASNSGIRSSRVQRDAAIPSATTAMSETAARHILASVTQKAKKLFVLLGTKQLEVMSDVNPSTSDAFDYDMLFNVARDNFVATNDTALRSLLSEFRDHNLVVTSRDSGAGEALWIPLRKDALTKIIQDLQTE